MDCRCYRDLAAIPEPVDCVVLAVPNRSVPDLLESAAAAGVRAAVVFAAGFAETGAEGKSRQTRLEALSRERGFLICGPNCYGVLNVFGKAPLFASSLPPGFLAGPVALVSQSGGLSTTIANALMVNRHEALRIGLVVKVVPADRLLDECFDIVERIAKVPPETVKINLQVATLGLDMMGLRDALTYDKQMSAPAHVMLREELRKPLDDARANKGIREYLQMRDGPFQPEPFGPRAKKKPE